MSGGAESGKADINNDSLKPQDKNLLDNVSLMTTISPMPSQNNSLQPHGGVNTQDMLDGIFSNGGRNAHKTEQNMSTETAIEEKLLAQLHDTGDTMGSSVNPKDTGGAKIMYGFDLSPIHSVDKGSVYTTTQEDFPSTEKLRNRGEFQKAPNFLQAKVASRQLRSEKSGANDDTETVMSQVYSSQDVTSSVNENFLLTSKDDLKLQDSIGQVDEVRIVAGSVEKTKDSKPKAKINGLNPSVKQRKPKPSSTTTASKGRISSNRSTPARKSSSAPALEVVAPKSPKTRQSAVKVTPRMKTSPKKMFKKSHSQKSTDQSKETLSPSVGFPQRSKLDSPGSPSYRQTYKSFLESSAGSSRQSLVLS